MNTVIFTGHDTPGFFGVIFHQHAVDGLQGKHINHRSADPFLLKLTRCLKGFRHHDPVGYQGDVVTFAQHITFANRERRTRRVDARRLFADRAYPVKTVEIDKLPQDILEHHRIGHFQHHRMREAAHNPHIFK